MQDKRSIKVNIINAFSYLGQGGSPTGIAILPAGLSDDHLTRVAAQSKASHIVYISDSQLPQTNYKLSFFTRNGEIKNCAHGTIAAHWYLATH